mgnify:CR=1 FL=1
MVSGLLYSKRKIKMPPPRIKISVVVRVILLCRERLRNPLRFLPARPVISHQTMYPIPLRMIRRHVTMLMRGLVA